MYTKCFNENSIHPVRIDSISKLVPRETTHSLIQTFYEKFEANLKFPGWWGGGSNIKKLVGGVMITSGATSCSSRCFDTV